MYNNCIKNRTFLDTKRGSMMLVVKSMNVRENFKEWCNKVIAGETIIVSRPKNKNVVIISEAEYNEMMKAKRNADYLAMLDKSMQEAKEGGFIVKTIEELEAMSR